MSDLRDDIEVTETIDDEGQLKLTDTDGHLLNNITFFEDEVPAIHSL